MSIEFEFISADDKPALLALTNPEYVAVAQTVLGELGFKVHVATNHDEFATRFSQIQYQVVLIEEAFACPSIAENYTLANLQWMAMGQRRHTVIILLGPSFETLHAMQAFQQSVHAVVNPNELATLGPIIQKVVADTNLFLHIYRDAQSRAAQGKTN